MVEQSNRIAAVRKRKFPGWDARAVHGDLIDRCSRGQTVDPRITDPNGEYQVIRSGDDVCESFHAGKTCLPDYRF